MDIDTIRASMDEASFSQEYENRFIGEEDSYFPYALLKQCVNPELANTHPDRTDLNYHIGVDFGRKKDMTAIVALENHTIAGKHIRKVSHIKLFRNTPFDQQLAHIRGLLANPLITQCRVDSSGMGLPLNEQLRDEFHSKISGITFTNDLKERLMVSLKLLFEQRAIEIPNDPQLITSLHLIQRKQTPGSHVQFDSPRTDTTGHSDLAWALALATYAAPQPSWHLA